MAQNGDECVWAKTRGYVMKTTRKVATGLPGRDPGDRGKYAGVDQARVERAKASWKRPGTQTQAARKYDQSSNKASRIAAYWTDNDKEETG
jgi:hypothetical protein